MWGRWITIAALLIVTHGAFPPHPLIGDLDMDQISDFIVDYDSFVAELEHINKFGHAAEPKQIDLQDEGLCHANFTMVGREGETLGFFLDPITCADTLPILPFFDLCDPEFANEFSPPGETIYDICCVCPSPTPTPSSSPSHTSSATVTLSVSFTRSASPSATGAASVSPSHTPSPSSDSAFGIPPVTFISAFGGDGTRGWLDTLINPSSMTGQFGFSLSSTPGIDEAVAQQAGVSDLGEAGLLIGSLRHVVDWNDALSAGAVSTGNVLLASVDPNGAVTSRRNTAAELLNALNRIVDVEVDDAFGCGVREVGDLDGNGVPDIVVGSRWSDLNVEQAGSFFLLFMDLVDQPVPQLPRLAVVDFYEFGLEVSQSARHADYVNIPDTFEGTSRNWYLLGQDFASIDFDGDGRQEIVVGMPGCFDCFDADLGSATVEWEFPGALIVLGLDVPQDRVGLNRDNILRFAHAIEREDIEAALGRSISIEAEFGYAIKPFVDVTGDGIPELLIGAPGINEERGSIFLTSLTYDENGASLVFLQELEPPEDLANEARFGSSLDVVPDMNFDASPEVLIGVPFKQLDRDPNRGTGFAYMVSLTTSRSDLCQLYAEANNLELATVELFVECGDEVTGPFIDGMRTAAFFVRGDNTIVTPEIDYKFVLRVDGSVVPSSSGWQSRLSTGDGFGESVASVGDIDGDGTPDIAIGAPYHSGAGVTNEGAVYMFSLTLPSPSRSATPSVTASITASPSATVSMSQSPSPSVSPSASPTPSIGACQDKCVVPREVNEFRCVFDATDLEEPVLINNEGTLVSPDGTGSAEFDFGSFSSSSRLWALTRCNATGTNTTTLWTVNGRDFDVPASDDFAWHQFGAVRTLSGQPGILSLEAAAPLCEVKMLYYGTEGESLTPSSGPAICTDNRARGYLCATEISLSPSVLLDATSMAFVSRLPFPLNTNGRADLRFQWNPDWGLADLYFYARCPNELSNTWKINGTDFHFNTSSEFQWHYYGAYESSCVPMQPVDTGCEIKFAYLGRDVPDENAIPSCPVDEARCTNEAVFSGFDLVGINGPALSGTCAPGAAECEGSALYDFGSNRGPLWLYAKCPSESENTWMVEDHVFDIPVGTDFEWQFFGNVECDRVLLQVIEANCEVAQIFRGYFAPFNTECDCPWGDKQRMYVLEGLGEAENENRTGFGTLQELGSDGERINGVCGLGFHGPTQMTRDSQGNFYVADSLSSRVIRVSADCSEQFTVVEWPLNEVGRPEGVAIGHDDTILYVSDSARATIFQIILDADGMFVNIFPTPFPPGHYSSIEVLADGTVYAAGTRSILTWNPATDVVETLVSSELLAVDVVDIAIHNVCAGLYFTTNNNQLWFCEDRTDGRTCHQFCTDLVDSTSCVYLRHPYGVSVDCGCQVYVTSEATGGLVTYDMNGIATELTSSLVMPKDLYIDFDDDIYDELCCHTPLPTRPPQVPDAPGADNSIPLEPLDGPCVQNVNCMWGSCQDDNSWCECLSFAFGCQCDLFAGTKPNPFECIDSDPPIAIAPHVPCDSCDNQVLYGVSDFSTVYRAPLDAQGNLTSAPSVCHQFINVFDIELDSLGGVFVADFGGGQIARVSPNCSESVIVTQWPAHRIASPQSIMIKDGSLFVADSGTNTIWRVRVKADYSLRDLQPVTTDLVFVTKLEDGPGNTFYAIELGNQLSVFDMDTNTKTVLVSAADRIVGLSDLAISSCGVFLSLPELNQVWRCEEPVSRDSCNVHCMQSGGDSCENLEDPSGLAIGCDCNVYAANSGNGVMVRYTPYNNGTITNTTLGPLPATVILDGATGLQDIEILSSC